MHQIVVDQLGIDDAVYHRGTTSGKELASTRPTELFGASPGTEVSFRAK